MSIFKKSEKQHQSEILQELRQAMESVKMPSRIRQIANKEVETLSGISAEYTAGLIYIDYLIGVPWDKKTEDNPDLLRMERVLKERHYGLHKIKGRILEHLAREVLMTSRILIVDDEKLALESLDHILKKEGYSVTTANDGKEALKKLESSDFDLVMTDLKMKKISGMDVLEKTKSKYPDTQVIMITGYATIDTAVDAIRKGAFNYVNKPIKLDEVRSVVKEALEKKLTTRTPKGSVLCFAGPPGTGKAALGKAIAEGLGRKFARISLDGMKDEAEIMGSGKAHAGAMPGHIIEKIRQTGSANPVLMLNGLDKIKQDFKGDATSTLLQVLDPEQNCNFIDHYLDVPFDLSSVMFIVTADIADDIQGPLRDRMEVIEFSGYTEDEKIRIALEYLIPRQIYEKGMSDHPPEFTPETVSEIIQGYTREIGIKDLEKQISTICRKITADEFMYNDEMLKKIKLGPELVERYLGPRKY